MKSKIYNGAVRSSEKDFETLQLGALATPGLLLAQRLRRNTENIVPVGLSVILIAGRNLRSLTSVRMTTRFQLLRYSLSKVP